MRNLGHGSVALTGIPAGSSIRAAFLMWDILDNSQKAAQAAGIFNNHAITGSLLGTGLSPCWSATANNYSYVANVTRYVTGNGTYSLSGFDSGQTDGADPFLNGSTPPDLEGASLIAVYANSHSATESIHIYGGASEALEQQLDSQLSGFSVPIARTAQTTFIVADGQGLGSSAAFNGVTLPSSEFLGSDPQAIPPYSSGNLWDTRTFDVSQYVHPGDQSATATVTANNDCLVWVGQVLAIAHGGGLVIGLGDSVAAGYGLSPVSNNGLAYPAQVAAKLSAGYDDLAVPGACVSEQDALAGAGGTCAKFASLDTQIVNLANNKNFGEPVSLITITIGANDIAFDQCIYDAIEGTANNSTDPCNQSNLAVNLSAMQESLKNALGFLASPSGFPGVPIIVTSYYNPLPSASAPVCSLSAAATAIAFVNQIGLVNTVTDMIFRPDLFVSGVKTVQGALYSRAQSVLSALNGAIDTAAASYSQVHVTALSSAFSNHDMCAASQAWMFGPQVNVTANFDLGFVHKSASYSLTPLKCPYPGVLDQALFPPINASTGPFSLHASGSSNCLPHPTAKGQQEIARQILRTLAGP